MTTSNNTLCITDQSYKDMSDKPPRDSSPIILSVEQVKTLLKDVLSDEAVCTTLNPRPLWTQLDDPDPDLSTPDWLLKRLTTELDKLPSIQSVTETPPLSRSGNHVNSDPYAAPMYRQAQESISPSSDKERGSPITVEHVKELIQNFIHAAQRSANGSLWEKFVVAPYHEEQLVAAIQKAVTTTAAPSNEQQDVADAMGTNASIYKCAAEQQNQQVYLATSTSGALKISEHSAGRRATQNNLMESVAASVSAPSTSSEPAPESESSKEPVQPQIDEKPLSERAPSRLDNPLAPTMTTALPSPSHVPTPPSSPKEPALAMRPMTDAEELIRAAISQAEAVVSSRPPMIWDQDFGPNHGVQLLSTLDAALAVISKTKLEAEAQGQVPQPDESYVITPPAWIIAKGVAA